MANMYFNENFEVCTVEHNPMYLYIDDVKSFLQDCGDEWISDGVNEPGVYQWDDCIWSATNSNIDDKIRKLVEEINSLRLEKSYQDNNKITGWNILITFNNGETIKINSELVSIDEVHEVINTLLKPCFFGKRVKKFEIVAE